MVVVNWSDDDEVERLFNDEAKKKYICVYCHMSTKSRVGRSGLIFFFIIIEKTGNSRSRFRNPIPVFNFRKFR